LSTRGRNLAQTVSIVCPVSSVASKNSISPFCPGAKTPSVTAEWKCGCVFRGSLCSPGCPTGTSENGTTGSGIWSKFRSPLSLSGLG